MIKEEAKEIKGIVVATTEHKTEKGKRYGIKLKAKEDEEPAWYNGFGSLPDVTEGDIIIIKYTEKQGENEIFRNIKEIKKVEKQEQKTIEEATKEKQEKQEYAKLALKTMALGISTELAKNGAFRFPEFSDFIKLTRLIEMYLEEGLK